MPELLGSGDTGAAAVARAGASPVRRVLIGAGFAVAVALFVVANRHDVPDAVRAARHAQPVWLAVGLAASAAFVAVYGLARRAALTPFGVVLPRRRAVVVGMVAHSVNIVTKSGGMAGLAVYRDEARRAGEPSARVLGGYVLAVVLGDLAFACTLAAALTVLVVDGRFTRGDALASAGVAVYFAIVASTVVAATRSRDAVRRLFALPARLRRRTPDHRAADELFDAVVEVRHRPAALVPAFAAMLAIEALGVVMVWCALEAYGTSVSLTAPIVGYAISVLFSMIGVLPAGLGFAEASLGAVLLSYGVPGATAAVVVLTYRVFETWVPLGAGLVAARVWRRHDPTGAGAGR